MSNFSNLNPETNYSAGLHPWHLKNETAEQNFLSLKSTCQNKNILSIGECGLDKICTTDFSLQQQYFKKQIQLANVVGKPLLIHCVRAFEEVLKILSEEENHVPVIFHGFTKSFQVAQSILQRGYYLSFGKHLLNKHFEETFRTLPLDKIFFETDDSVLPIADIYKAAANIKELDVEIVCHQILKNTMRIFGEKFLTHDA